MPRRWLIHCDGRPAVTDKVAVECGPRRLTWSELDARANAFGNGVDALGAGSGGHVAICVSNRFEFVETVLGAWRAGAAYTPLKTGWTADEIGWVLDDARSNVVVTDRPAAASAARERGIAVVELDDGYEQWLEAQSDRPLPADRCGYKMPYTSGTTGRPKGVVMAGANSTPYAAGWAGLTRWAEALSLPGEGVHLFVSRLFNGAPQTFGFAAMARGATLRILPRWDAAAALDAVAVDDETSSIMVPTMFRQLLALSDVDRSRPPAPNLKTLLHGGEPCPVAIKQAMADWFGDVLVEYYGFTEGGLTVVGPHDWQSRPGTVGRPLPGMHVRILDDTGADVPAGSEGTVYFASDQGRRFAYAGDEDKTDKAHVGDAFTVGDIGRLDEDGFLYLCGRSADVVITSGVNVYPAEIEQALADVEGVVDMCAVGAPDTERGEAIVLFVVPATGVEVAPVEAALKATSDERLAPYKRPQSVVFVDALPRDETGKLLRRLLRDAG